MATQAFSPLWVRSFIALSCASVIIYCVLRVDADTKAEVMAWRPAVPKTPFTPPKEPDCEPFDVESFLNLAGSHHMAENVTYFRRHLRMDKSLESPPPSPQERLESPLITLRSSVVVNSSSGEITQPLHCAPALDIPISSSKPSGSVDLSMLLFGVSTSPDRLFTSIPHFTRFLTKPKSRADMVRVSNGAGLVVLLHDADDQQIQTAENHLNRAGISAIVKHAAQEHSMAESYFSLVPTLYQHAANSSDTKRTWLVLIDDDTFFPHPQQLVTALRVFKNATTKSIFLGGQNEAMPERSPYFTLLEGGAGLFLSLPLAAQLLSPAKAAEPAKASRTINLAREASEFIQEEIVPVRTYDQCMIEDKDVIRGDARLSFCIHNHTSVRISPLPGLHQLDMSGDPSGFYESGTQILSMHHWKSWHFLDPTKMSLAGDVCGEDCVLQRWMFASNEGQGFDNRILPPVVLTNGYSLVQYTQGLLFDWDVAESTFDDLEGRPKTDMDYGLGPGPLREKMTKQQKRTWWFLDAVGNRELGVRQWYGYKNARDQIESVAELIWLP